MAVAKYLEGHKNIEQVDYLGLDSHPLHELAKKYMVLVDSEHDELYGEKINRYGHLMSFRVRGGAQETRDIFDRMQRIWRAVAFQAGRDGNSDGLIVDDAVFFSGQNSIPVSS